MVGTAGFGPISLTISRYQQILLVGDRHYYSPIFPPRPLDTLEPDPLHSKTYALLIRTLTHPSKNDPINQAKFNRDTQRIFFKRGTL